MAKPQPPMPPKPEEVIRATLDMIYKEELAVKRLVEDILAKCETGLGRGGVKAPEGK